MTARLYYSPTFSGKKLGALIIMMTLGALLMYATIASSEYAHIQQQDQFCWWTLTSLRPASVAMVFLGLCIPSKGNAFSAFRMLALLACLGFAVMMAIGVFIYGH